MGHAFYPLPFQIKNKTTIKVFSFSSSFVLAFKGLIMNVLDKF